MIEKTVLSDVFLLLPIGKTERGAIAFDDTGILSIGKTESDLSEHRTGARRISIPDALVIPGFVDAHVHMLTGAANLDQVDLREAKSKDEFRRILKAWLDKHPGQSWVTGGFWDETFMTGLLPDKSWLDDLCPNRPVFLSRYDVHTGVANTKALELAKIDSKSPDPFDGRIVRDPSSGAATGLLIQKAMNIVRLKIPIPDDHERARLLANAIEYAHSLGLTSVHDIIHDWDELKIYKQVLAGNPDGLKFNIKIPIDFLDQLLDINHDQYPDRMTIDGVKGWTDGTLGTKTAWLRQPYMNSDNRGGPCTEDLDNYRANIKKAAAVGYSILLHAIGDKAIEFNLSVFQECIERGLGTAALRIEHFQHPSREDIKAMHHPRLVASMQPLHIRSDAVPAEENLGAERAALSSPFKTLLDMESNLIFGSDWPIVSLDPLTGIHAAVTRQDSQGRFPGGWLPNQKISIFQAIAGYTSQAAKVSGLAGRCGELTVNAMADLTVLNRDITSIPPDDIPKAKAIMTVVNGRIVYEDYEY